MPARTVRGGHGDAVLHGHRVGGAVPHDDGALHAEQRRAAVGVRRHLLLERAERALHEQRPQLWKRRGHERGLQRLRMSVLAVPSMVFRQTLPVNPSVTTTSKSPARRSPPSRLPAKAGTASVSRRVGLLGEQVALRVLLADVQKTDLRVFHPHDSVHRTPSPIWANCTRYSGLQSALAPTSMSRVGRAQAGMTWPKAGRFTPLMRPTTRVAAARQAPVEPAEKKPSRGALLHEAAAHDDGGVLLGLRTAPAGCSPISMTSVAACAVTRS